MTNTEAQSNILKEQFSYYKGLNVRVETIRVAYLDKVRIPQDRRKRCSLITAGRLQSDKRTDWMIEAVVMAKNEIPELSLDIYGEGNEKAKLQDLINELGCDSYVHLCGFQKLEEVYQNYEAYVCAS